MKGRPGRASPLPRELVGVAEVAARLGLTAERVRQVAKSGVMPEPIGELGRRLIWDWRDVEAWARLEGRLDSNDGESRQVAQPWRRRPRGAMHLVVDEILQWGPRDSDVCHARIWAPVAGSTDAQIVLLGQLEDQVSSISNDVEAVAMAVAVRHLGPAWRVARFYQYGPATLLDDTDTYLYVTFSIRPRRASSHRQGRHDSMPWIRELGAEFAEPDWRESSLDELEHLTGDSPKVWASGTYTRDLVECARVADGVLELTWDPDHARDLSILAAELGESTHSGGIFLTSELNEQQLAGVKCLLDDAATNAYEIARQDVATQPVDAAIALRPPQLQHETRLLAAADRKRIENCDPRVLWDALTTLRQGLIDNRFVDGPVLERERQLLVRGLRGGWVTLHWADAGVEELHSAREGWGCAIALPDDLISDDQPTAVVDTAELTVLLLDTIAGHLERAWPEWTWHDVPVFVPSTVVAATGPLSQNYLAQLSWKPVAEADPARLRRLTNRRELDQIAVDHDGWLVASPKDRSWYVCEWPVSGPCDASLADQVIRADRPASIGSTGVYLVGPDGALRSLPSAGHRHHGNSFAWGYGGGGPWDLRAAVVDLLNRASGSNQLLDRPTVDEVIGELVARPRTPNWRVGDLLDQVRGRSPRRRAKSASRS